MIAIISAFHQMQVGYKTKNQRRIKNCTKKQNFKGDLKLRKTIEHMFALIDSGYSLYKVDKNNLK